MCATRRRKAQASTPSDKRHRFPPEVIGPAVWRYFRFALRYREVEELLAERGVALTDETVRPWCRKFGHSDANALRQRRPQPGDTWQLDAVFVSINGVQHALWRAVDQEGLVRDILVQARRDEAAATEFLRKLLKKRAYVPRVLITDTLASYSAARRAVWPSVAHRRHTGLHKRAEHAHQPMRERARRLRRCKDPGHAQRLEASELSPRRRDWFELPHLAGRLRPTTPILRPHDGSIRRVVPHFSSDLPPFWQPRTEF